MKDLLIEELLQKNPKAKEIFEENAKKIANLPMVNRKKKGYGLALPYSGNHPNPKGQTDKNTPVAATCQRY